MIQLIIRIAGRYLKARKSQNLINIITLISAAGVAVGTFALIVVLSVFNGFDQVISGMINAVSPDLVILPKEGKVLQTDTTTLTRLAGLPGVAGISRVIEEDALFVNGSKQHLGRIKGVESYYQSSGRFDTITQHGRFVLNANGFSFAIAGSGVVWYLGLNPAESDKLLTIYVPIRGDPSQFSPDQGFNSMSLRVADVFASQQDYDSRYVYVPFDWAAQLLEYQTEANAIELFVNAGAKLSPIRSQVATIFDDMVVIKDRFEQQETLYRIMRTERWAIFIILAFILFMATFNVVGSLTMIIVDKQKDSNVLRFLGLPLSAIRELFVVEGIFISLAGALTGLLSGILVVSVQEKFGLLKLGGGQGAFVIDAYPVELRLVDIGVVMLTVVTIGLLASVYAVRYALRDAKVQAALLKN
jgi:ABC-type lipoprotein release transport system permease subunit